MVFESKGTTVFYRELYTYKTQLKGMYSNNFYDGVSLFKNVMNTEDFKNKFKQNPEGSYILYYLQQFILLGKFNNLIGYFRKTKSIDDVNDIEELYKIKGQIFLLKSSCAHIVDLIDRLDFHVTEEFDDRLMTLEEIGINDGDKFQCIKDYLHWDFLYINTGSIISIEQFRYAGGNSLFSARIEKLITKEKDKMHFPDPEELPLILNFNELNNYFCKV